MAIRFDDIGNRLKAFRLGSGLGADEIATRLGISRTALYRFEKGELAKIETLEKLAELLGVSVPTLLGVGVEYIASAIAYFERMRQIEETSEHIIVLAGPISYLLASDAFDRALEDVLRESIPEKIEGRQKFSPLVAGMYSEFGALNKWVHIWAYKDANERARIREESRKDGSWPPATRGMFVKQENMLVVPASFSPLR